MQVLPNNRLAGIASLDLERTTPQRASRSPATRPVSDRVSLSPEALKRASEAPPASPASTTSFSAAAHADASKADGLARDFAYTEDRAAMDISGLMPGGDGIVRYSATGKPVTPESEAAFAKEASRIRQGRISLYESEKSKGTRAAEIFDKIAAFMGTQQQDFLRHTGWDRVIAE